jgi:2-polyprenyl-6-methoxyphenol hydroxylase-like FAD-dependent oxidoreductase
MRATYDLIVAGARCAGSPTAMLLARKGYRVLVIDRATFPSDTLSTHIVQPHGVAALARWGLLERLAATGCPPISTYTFDFGPVIISGAPGTAEAPASYCPRRRVLDHLLVQAAADSGAEIREQVTLEDLVFDGSRVTGISARTAGGTAITEHASVVIGADGWHSVVAERAGAGRYDERPPLCAAYYSYWSNLPVGHHFEIHVRPHRAFGAAPTHDGLTMVIGGWPYAEFAANKQDVEGHFLKMLELVPDFADRLRGARREARFSGAALPNYFRQAYGPGWTLVGDAGYLKDSITAQGISDAFRDAERCARALDEALSGTRPFDAALADYQLERDAHAREMYELTCQLARMEPPPPEMQQLLGAIQGNQEAMDGFVRINSGTMRPSDFFAPEHIARMTGAARAET